MALAKKHIGEPIKIGERIYKLLDWTILESGEEVKVLAQGRNTLLPIDLTKDEFLNGLKDGKDVPQD